MLYFFLLPYVFTGGSDIIISDAVLFGVLRGERLCVVILGVNSCWQICNTSALVKESKEGKIGMTAVRGSDAHL